jgi:hypothetical protein
MPVLCLKTDQSLKNLSNNIVYIFLMAAHIEVDGRKAANQQKSAR